MDFDFECHALTIDELLSKTYRPVPPSKQDFILAKERLQQWQHIASDNSDDALYARLARLSIDHSDLIARLGGVERVEGKSEPDWVRDVRSVMEALKTESDGLQYQEIPFGPLLAPLLNQAIDQLRFDLDASALSKISDPAFQLIVDHLSKRVSNLCELPFYGVLLEWRSSQIVEAKGGNELAASNIMAKKLEPFAIHMRETGFDSLLRAKPILFRLIASLIEQWKDTYSSFITRLNDDWEEISNFLNCDLSAVETLDWGLSDPHNGGRSVISIKFSSGSRILYKPKSLEADNFVRTFVSTLQTHGFQKLLVPRAISKNGYGWTEFVKNLPCTTPDEVRLYYERFGAWLAVFYTLGASDMHMENFLSYGSQPVPIDFETILQGLRQRPRLTDGKSEATWEASRFLEDSVQSVGMLPTYIHDHKGGLISQGALEQSEYSVKSINWEEMNTPRMILKTTIRTERVSSNLPTLAGQSVGITNYKDDFSQGFAHALNFITNHGYLADFDWECIEAMPIRRVLRPTRFYYMLLKRLYDPQRMGDSVTWSMQADFIARFFDWHEEADQPWKVLKSERRQLLQLNIPYFSMTAGDNIICDSLGPITRLHVELGPDIFKERLQVGLKRSNTQCDIVRASLQIEVPAKTPPSEIGSVKVLIQEIREELIATAFKSSSSMSWLTRFRVDHDTAAQINIIGHDIYYGSSGVGLFFSALHEAGDDEASKYARMAMAGVIKSIQSEDIHRLSRAVGIGGMVGMGSIAYALGKIGISLDDEEMVEASYKAVRYITNEAIENDNQYDLVSGSAGAILALLYLYKHQPEDWIVERALACSSHLLRRMDAKTNMWHSSKFDMPLTGAAHGAAGFATAFSGLYRLTGNDKHRIIVQDCIEFENAHYDLEIGNWRDTRNKDSYPNQWCYGAVGIGLLRLAMMGDGAIDDLTLTHDVQRALRSCTLVEPKNHTLCCGLGGFIELRALAATKLNQPELRAWNESQVSNLISHWNEHGDIHWVSGSKHLNPGLYQGLAGVGLYVLRLSQMNFGSPLILQ